MWHKCELVCSTSRLLRLMRFCLFPPEWMSTRKMLEPPEELTQNGRSEPLQHDEQQVMPVAAAAPPLAQVNLPALLAFTWPLTSHWRCLTMHCRHFFNPAAVTCLVMSPGSSHAAAHGGSGFPPAPSVSWSDGHASALLPSRCTPTSVHQTWIQSHADSFRYCLPRLLSSLLAPQSLQSSTEETKLN